MHLFMQWVLETTAFVLLPLVVYLLVYLALGEGFEKTKRLPEWMLITILLHADAMRKLLLFFKDFQGYDLKLMRTLSFGLVGIVTACIFLALSLVAQERESFSLPSLFYSIQIGVFLYALYYSASVNIWLSIRKREADLLRRLIPTNQPSPAKSDQGS